MESENINSLYRININSPLNKKQLAVLLGVSPFVLNKMIELVKSELGNPVGRIYCVNQVEFLVKKYGIVRK